MKNKILIILGVILVLVVGGVLLSLFNKEKPNNNNNEENYKPNIQDVNLTEETINDTKIENKIEINNSKVECKEEICTISMSVKNPTSKAIDMNEYRISFLDSTGEEIYWFSGASIGIVDANATNLISLEIPKTLTNINTIKYQKNY